MSEQLNRQQRRQLMREEVKKKYISSTPEVNPPQTNITSDQFQMIAQDLHKVLNYAKMVENHVWSVVETLTRKNILDWDDVHETENLYALREQKRKERIKELLADEKTVPEYLEIIKEDPHLPGYEKMNIHPIKDLNLNPYEIAAYLKELNPDLTEEEYVNLRKDWNLNGEHFGFRKLEEEKK